MQKSATESGPKSESETDVTENKTEHSDAKVEDTKAPSSKSTSGEETDSPTLKPDLSITAEAALNSAKEWGSMSQVVVVVILVGLWLHHRSTCLALLNKSSKLQY